MSSWNADVYRTLSPSEGHWKLCREFIDRYRHFLPEEQVVALAHDFASSQLLKKSGDVEADQLRRIVWDQLPVGAGVIPTGEVECWEREAEPEFLRSSSDDEVTIEKWISKNEPEEVVEISDDDDPMEKSSSSSSRVNKPFKIVEVTQLTRFKPVETLRNTEDIHRSLVIVDSDFGKTCREFDKLGLGCLVVLDEACAGGGFRCVVSVKTSKNQFPLVEAFATALKRAKQKVKKVFLKEMKQVCFQIVAKRRFSHPEKEIARLVDPATNIAYYRSMLETFSKQLIQQVLTFSKDFSQAELEKLNRIAIDLNLTPCTVGPQNKRMLKIVGQSIPALAVVERIVVQKDPELSQLYEVIPPSFSGMHPQPLNPIL